MDATGTPLEFVPSTVGVSLMTVLRGMDLGEVKGLMESEMPEARANDMGWYINPVNIMTY